MLLRERTKYVEIVVKYAERAVKDDTGVCLVKMYKRRDVDVFLCSFFPQPVGNYGAGSQRLKMLLYSYQERVIH